MAAKFLVVRHPGAQVAGVGFVRAGQFFQAPAKVMGGDGKERDWQPSRHMRALNEEGVALLRKLKAGLEKYDAERALALREEIGTDKDGKTITRPMRDPDGRPIVPPKLADDVNLAIWEREVEAPVVEESGLSLQDLAELGGGPKAKSVPTPKRLADR